MKPSAHDRPSEFVRAQDAYDRAPTRNNRRKLAIAARKARVTERGRAIVTYAANRTPDQIPKPGSRPIPIMVDEIA